MTCNRNQGPNSKTVSAKGGDKITVTWAHNTRGDEVIADSHKGPVQVYIAPGSSNGKGNVWVKIASEGYEGGRWATDKLRANKGQHSFTLPQLAPGDYLVRPEIIALHEGSRPGGTQLYMACVQIKLSGTGTKVCRERLGEEVMVARSGRARRHFCLQISRLSR
jgi:cellulase